MTANNTTTSIKIADEIVINKIYLIRGQKVMLDIDLAAMYQRRQRRMQGVISMAEVLEESLQNEKICEKCITLFMFLTDFFI